jgi:hypothetical protein
MKHPVWKSIVFIVVLLLVVLLNSGHTLAAETPANAGPQATATPALGENSGWGASSQGDTPQVQVPRGLALDDLRVNSAAAAVSYYHIPGSVLTPVSSATTLDYDFMGCIHATAGASNLLNAPLNIPPGSRITLLRLYYDDTSTSDIQSWITRYNPEGTSFEDLVTVASSGTDGHGSNYGTLDHVVDPYGWSYVLVVRLNGTSPTLQVCGLRVMYYPPVTYYNFTPNVVRDPQ